MAPLSDDDTRLIGSLGCTQHAFLLYVSLLICSGNHDDDMLLCTMTATLATTVQA